jgi:xanthosine utilization system XapX-like protein
MVTCNFPLFSGKPLLFPLSLVILNTDETQKNIMEVTTMKALNTIIKILTALAAIAGVVYIVATYGEQIVAWAKKILNSLPKCPACEEAEEEIEVEFETAAEEVAAEEPAAEEVPVEEPAPEVVVSDEEFVPEVVVSENEPVAEETDFAE